MVEQSDAPCEQDGPAALCSTLQLLVSIVIEELGSVGRSELVDDPVGNHPCPVEVVAQLIEADVAGERSREVRKQAQAVAQDSHLLREAGRELPGGDCDRCADDLVGPMDRQLSPARTLVVRHADQRAVSAAPDC
jgi:hypothetical protein